MPTDLEAGLTVTAHRNQSIATAQPTTEMAYPMWQTNWLAISAPMVNAAVAAGLGALRTGKALPPRMMSLAWTAGRRLVGPDWQPGWGVRLGLKLGGFGGTVPA